MLSEIDEYTILFTTRVHQKQKSWQDGLMKHYKLNNKIEILNDDGVIVSSEFRKVSFVLDEQYVIGKVMIEILSLNESYTREVTIKKEKDTGVVIKTGPRVVKPESPQVKSEPKKLLKAPSLPLKHTIKPMTAGLSRNYTQSSPRGTKSISVKAEPQQKSQQKPHQKPQQKPQISVTPTESTPTVQPKTPLKFKIVEPIIKRIPPRSA